MIAAWMLYAVVIGALLGGGGLAAERILRTHGLPTRGGWLVVMLLSVGWPLGHWAWEYRPSPPPAAVLGLALPESPEAPSPAILPLKPLVVEVPPESMLRHLDRPIMVIWALASGVLLLFFAFVLFRTRRLQRQWEGGEAVGHPVLYSQEWGPAVVGILSPRIVLPGWCREMDDGALRFILDHELEHVRAGDLRLIAFAGILPVLFPWHLPLWWQLASLRAAIEGDCDLRVLKKNPGQTRPYVGLLLDVGERVSGRPLLTAMLSEPYATLKRRIKVMTMPFPERPWVRGGVMAGVGALMVLLACWAPGPVDAPGTEADVQQETAAAPDEPASELELTPAVFTPYTVRPGIKNVEEVRQALLSAYPTDLREAGVEGTARVWFFLDEEGGVVNVQLNESSGYPELDEVALRSAGLFQFSPALNRDRPVPVWVSLPIFFSASGDVPEMPKEPRSRQSTRRIGVPMPAGGMEALTGLPQSEVTGVVKDAQSGAPLQQVQVYLPGTHQGTLTNEEGRFVISRVPPATCSMPFQQVREGNPPSAPRQPAAFKPE